MSYLVLARKYRPILFEQMIGQDHIVRTLYHALQMQRVHHAFVFTGARGVGKTTVARLLARALNCVVGPSMQPCGTCHICIDMLAGSCPDVLEIDGASHTGVDNVRDLRDSVPYLPSVARFKIYIIDEVHMLSQAAFNALLKTLEEPPAHVKFIFATTEPHKIPATILSRCQRFDFRRVGLAPLVLHLQTILRHENLQLDEALLQAIAAEAAGSVRDALSLLDQVLSYIGHDSAPCDKRFVLDALGMVDQTLMHGLCKAIFLRDAQALLEIVEHADVRGYDLVKIARLLAAYIRDLAVLKSIDKPGAALLERNTEEQDAMRALCGERSMVDIQRLFAQTMLVVDDVMRSSLPRISLEMGLLRLLHIAPVCDLENIFKRLDMLQDNTPSAALPIKLDFKSLVDNVRGVRPALASVLEHGRLLTLSAQKLHLAFSAETFYLDSARDADNQALLKKILLETYGCAAQIVIDVEKEADMQIPSMAETIAQTSQTRSKTIEEEALQHVAVRNAVSILGAEVKHIKVLDKE